MNRFNKSPPNIQMGTCNDGHSNLVNLFSMQRWNITRIARFWWPDRREAHFRRTCMMGNKWFSSSSSRRVHQAHHYKCLREAMASLPLPAMHMTLAEPAMCGTTYPASYQALINQVIFFESYLWKDSAESSLQVPQGGLLLGSYIQC